MKKLAAFIVPEGLLVVAAAIVVQGGGHLLRGPVASFGRFYPIAVLAAGLAIGWRFQRSRLVFALIGLALADRALLLAPDNRVVFHAAALLLPLNLTALVLLAERGILTPAGLLQLAVLLVQVGAVALLASAEPAATAAVLRHAFVPRRWFAWTPIAQPALLTFGAAFAVLAVRLTVQPSAIGRGFLWALVATFLALNAAPTIYFATAGLVLVVAVIEASYVMAYHDGLTGLPARRALHEALLRAGRRYTVAMVDVDHFKQFNDRYGHDVGDQVLRMVGAALAQVSGGGKAFRYGGEEFALVFSGRTVDECAPHLEELRRTVEATSFTVRGRVRPLKKPARPKAGRKRRKQLAVTVSIGVAERGERRDTPEAVITAADRALYRAKEAGRNRVVA